MGEVAHSKIGASSMHRWAECPGSVRLSVGIQSKSSVYADEGTKAHDIAATLLKGGLVGNEDPEMMEAVLVYVKYVSSLTEKPSKSLVEQKFDLSHIHPGLFGTADAVVYHVDEKVLHVIDYKHGAGIPVEVEENEQLMYYGIGALFSLQVPVKSIVLTIVQPRCFHPSGPVRSWEVSPSRLLDFIGDLKEAALATEKADAPLVPGEHCRFCPASGICPELSKRANSVAKTEFSKVEPYNPEDLKKALDSIPLIEAWIAGVNSFAYGEAERGRCPPGYKLVAKRATRKWTDVQATEEFFRKEWPASIKQLMTSPKPEPISPAQAEKVVSKDQHQKLAQLISSVSSGYTLVNEADKRAPVLIGKTEFPKVLEGEFSVLS